MVFLLLLSNLLITLIQEWRNTAKVVSRFKCLQEHKQLRFTLQKGGLVLYSLAWTWDRFWKAMSHWRKTRDKKLSKRSEFYYLEPGLYPSITDIVEAMNTLIQERHNHSENCVTVKVSRRTQKVEIYFANEGSGLAIFTTNLQHILWSILVMNLE